MLKIGIAGASAVGKSSTMKQLGDLLHEEGAVGFAVGYELSKRVELFHTGLGLTTKPRTEEMRRSMRDVMEIMMKEHGNNLFLESIERDALECYEDSVDVLMIGGVRREHEAEWIRDHGGIVIWVGHEFGTPHWKKRLCQFDTTSPVKPEERPAQAKVLETVVKEVVRRLHEASLTAQDRKLARHLTTESKTK